MTNVLSRDEVEHVLDRVKTVLYDHEPILMRQMNAWAMSDDAQRARITELERERDAWHADASSHLRALCEKQAEVNGLEQQLEKVGQEQDHYRSCYQQVCEPDPLWQTNERQAKLIIELEQQVVALRAQLVQVNERLDAQRVRLVTAENALCLAHFHVPHDMKGVPVSEAVIRLQQQREQLERLVSAQLHVAEDIPRAALVQYEALKDVQAQLAAAQAEIAQLKGDQS